MTMSTHPRTGGAVSTLTLSGAQPAPRGTRRRPPNSIADQLERLSDRFDKLVYSVRLGIPSQRDYDRLADEAEAIAKQLRAAFRAPAAAVPDELVHPPLRQNGGQAWW